MHRWGTRKNMRYRHCGHEFDYEHVFIATVYFNVVSYELMN